MATLTELRTLVQDINKTYRDIYGKDLTETKSDIDSLGTDELQSIVDMYSQANTSAKRARPASTGITGTMGLVGGQQGGTGNLNADMKTAWSTGVVNTKEGTNVPTVGSPLLTRTPTVTTTSPTFSYMNGTPDASEQFYKAPTSTDIAVASKTLQSLGFTKSQADQMAGEELFNQASESAQAQYATLKKENELKDYLAQYPEQQKGIREALSKELGSYQSDLFNKELLPQVYQTMAARGLSGGSLDQAIAGSAEKLSREREATLAGMASQSSLNQSQLEYENALRQAQGAGLKESSLTDYARSTQESGKQMAYGAGQSSLQRAFQAQQNELANQRAIEAEQRTNAYNERAMGNQSWGNLYGTGLRGLIGAGIGLATGGLSGLATGALSGISGQYLPKDWYK